VRTTPSNPAKAPEQDDRKVALALVRSENTRIVKALAREPLGAAA
jgi:hypothetical protein